MAKQIQKIFLKRGDKCIGPITSQQIKQLAAEGKIQPNSLICPEENDKPSNRWVAASKIKGLSFAKGTVTENRVSASDDEDSQDIVTKDSLLGLTKKQFQCVLGGVAVVVIAAATFLVFFAIGSTEVEYYGESKKWKRYETKYAWGKKVFETYWHANGQKSLEIHCKNGKAEGLVIGWNDNGDKSSEGHYKDGKAEGLATEWHRNGQKSSETHHKNGEIELRTYWSPEGEKMGSLHYKDGKPYNGDEYRLVGDLGVNQKRARYSLDSITHYSRGEMLWHEYLSDKGKDVTYYKNGERDQEINYSKEGDEFSKYGEARYHDGKLLSSTSWYPNGKKKSSMHYKNDKLDGLWTTYYDNGDMKSGTEYKEGKKHGVHYEWEKGRDTPSRKDYYREGKITLVPTD